MPVMDLSFPDDKTPMKPRLPYAADFVGKTVNSIERRDVRYLRLHFTDGSYVELEAGNVGLMQMRAVVVSDEFVPVKKEPEIKTLKITETDLEMRRRNNVFNPCGEIPLPPPVHHTQFAYSTTHDPYTPAENMSVVGVPTTFEEVT